jgi:EAL domain-containing protein (putative c-di-GMP-specific phosphodiesterase class I)/ActR/RegA family two-component response regulator
MWRPCGKFAPLQSVQRLRFATEATRDGGQMATVETAMATRIAYILDDEPEFRDFITQVATAAGFSTRSFDDVTSLEMALTERLPEVIVLDLSLGDSDGIDVIRSLAASRYGGAILLISGRDAETIDEVSKLGARQGLTMLPFLQKPFQLEQFTERLGLLTSISPTATSEVALENALRNGQLELWYQPKIDLNSWLVCGAEALIRLRHPKRGILLPSVFLPSSGDSLHNPLADFVMRRSLADWSFLADSGLAIKLAINIPISIFETPEFVSRLRKYLPDHEAFPGLIVELTEDEIIRNPDLAREVAVQLKLYNVGVSIDDFGRGYSTLERVRTLPFAELKIDKSLVDGCSSNPEQHCKCNSIVDLAHRFGMVVVAEGVESASDVHALRRMNCDMAQGRVFAAPMEREHFRRWTKRHNMSARAGEITIH